MVVVQVGIFVQQEAMAGRGRGQGRQRVKGRGQRLLVGVVWGLCASALARQSWADSMVLTANWEYQSSRSNGSQLTEGYTVDLNKRIDITELMGLDALMRYDRRVDSQGARQHVMPSLRYGLDNYLFSLNLTATDDEEIIEHQGQRSTRQLDANWRSNWQRYMWLPSVATYYNQTWQDDTFEPHLHERDATQGGGRLDWDLGLARVFYSYSGQDDKDTVSGSESRLDTQQTRAETDASFWGGRAAVTLAHQYTQVSNDNQARVVGGVALLPVTITAYHGETIPDPATLAGKPQLTDGDLDVAAVTVNNPYQPKVMNIGLRTNFQSAEQVYLYTDIVLPLGTSSQFTWALYSSNNNIDWTLEQTAVLATYNQVRRRFEFFLPAISQEFIKLVATDDPATTAVNFTEIEAFQTVNASGTTVSISDIQTTAQTDVGLSLQLRPNLQLTSSYGYQKNTSTANPNMDNTLVNAGLVWQPAPAWPVRLNSSHSTRNRGGLLSDATRTHGVSLGFPTLPAVDSMVGVSLSQSEAPGSLINTTDYTLQFIADLYTDLNARLNLGRTDSDSQLGPGGGQTTYSQLQLTARLSPTLLANWSGLYSRAAGQGGDTFTTDARAFWRLTDRFSTQGGVSGMWGGELDGRADVFAGLDVLLTDTMQLSLNQRRQISEESNNITSLDWRWTINEYISMMTSGAFLYGGRRDEWSISSRLNTRLTHF